MTSPHRAVDRRGTAWMLAVFTFGWIGVLLVVTVLGALGVVADGIVRYGVDDLDVLMEALGAGDLSGLPTWVIVLTMAVQFPAMVALVPAAHHIADRLAYAPAEVPIRPHGWRGVFAWRPAPVAALALAVVAGLTVGWLPGWIAAELRAIAPWDTSGTLEMINASLNAGPYVWRGLFAFEIVVFAAFAEEAVFRGFFWDALDRVLPAWAVWGITSVVFAAYHMDPIQSSAVVITGFALGWVRWRTNSLAPAIVLHATNNGLGVLAAWFARDLEPSLVAALAGAAVAFVALACVEVVRRREAEGG